MGNAHVLILFILSLTVMTVTCQSYHFSIPDWTNEKKNTSILEEIVNVINKYVSQSNNVLANCELQKLKLLLQGSINTQVSRKRRKIEHCLATNLLVKYQNRDIFLYLDKFFVNESFHIYRTSMGFLMNTTLYD